MDSNSQTRGGRDSIVFSVTVAGKEAFRSKVMREGMPPERVSGAAASTSVSLCGGPETPGSPAE